jgi:uncharacterized membrane protein
VSGKPTSLSLDGTSDQNIRAEPRWPAVIAMIAIIALRFALPADLRIGPDWLLATAVGLLLVSVRIFHESRHYRANQIFGYILLAIVTGEMMARVTLLITRLPEHRETPRQLLTAALGIWCSNVLIFASWYWRLDGGGPNARDRRKSHDSGAFLFPQMQMRNQDWKPGFVDYLFLAFNTSTAFSPTDVPVLSRWAKVLMIIQSCISLGTVVVLAARAVNVL